MEFDHGQHPPPPPVVEGGEEIVVTGKRFPKQREYDPGTGGDPGTGTPGDDGGSGGGEFGGDGGSGEVPVEPLETPCVTNAPDGAPLHDINRQALRVTNTIENLNDGQDVEDFELGSLLYTLGGVAYTTKLFTQRLPDTVRPTATTLGSIPDGANIVGFVHNHTSTGASGDKGATPSSQDYNFFNSLRDHIQNNVGRDITVDNNALLYINGRENTMSNEQRKTRVYDNSYKNKDTPECSLH